MMIHLSKYEIIHRHSTEVECRTSPSLFFDRHENNQFFTVKKNSFNFKCFSTEETNLLIKMHSSSSGRKKTNDEEEDSKIYFVEKTEEDK